MQNATDAVRRPGRPLLPVSHASAINAANDLASTNSTSSRFIGTNQRSWMRPGTGRGTTPPGRSGLNSTNTPNQFSGRRVPTSRNLETTTNTTSDPGLTIRAPSIATPDAPAVQASLSSTTRSLSPYRFRSLAPELPPKNAGSADPNRVEQAEGISAVGLEPASINEQLLEDPRNTNKPEAEAEVREARTTPGDTVEVVDLTTSQPDQIEHETGVGSSLLSKQKPPAVTDTNATIAADTSGSPASATIHPEDSIPPIVRGMISADENEFRQQRTDSHSNAAVSSAPGPPQDVAAPTSGARRSASISTSAHGQTATATFSHPPSTQLLTPAASPLTQHNDQLQRKRPTVDISNLQHPQTRLRTESPQASSLTRHLLPCTTSMQSPSQDQITQHQPHTFAPPLQTAHQQSLPWQLSSTAPVQSQHLIHGRATSRPGPHWAAPQPRHADTIGSAVPVPTRGQSYLAGFDATIAEMVTRIDLSDRSQLRIPWIRDACQINDLFFLLLNQLLCTWHLNRELSANLGLDSTCDGGFRTLELLFASNTELPEELVAFLAGWPHSSYSLKANAELNQWVTNIGQFLPQFGLQWDDFRQKCINRRCPPTAREITDAFRCPPSTVLPRAIFSSLARQVEPVAPPEFHNAVYELFRFNQNDYLTAVFQHHLKHTLEADYRAFSIQYGHLLNQHLRRVSATLVPSSGQPSLSNTCPTLTRNLQSHFTLPSQRHLPDFPTAHQDVTSLNQDLINSIAAGGPAPIHANSLSPNASAPRVRPSINTGNGTVHNRAPVSPVAQSPINGMGPIRTNFTRTKFQPLSNGALPVSATFHNAALNAQPSRTQIFRPNAASHAAQPLLPDLRNLPPFLTNPLPEQEALHLAHLRQPRTEVKGATSGKPPRLYQSIQSCILGPHPCNPERAFFEFLFELSPDLVRRKADTTQPPVASFKLPKRIFTTDSLLFNLRCAQLRHDEELPGESDWSALPTYYPQHIFISINDEHLELRRKRQFRKDLPVDVTPFVRAGQNIVKVSVHGEKNKEGKNFAIAVEVIGLQDHSQAFKMPTKISASDSLRSITSTMQPAAHGDDDDMQFLNDSIVLSITDPFLSSMFTIPVRGKKCKHHECFDLETFLRSRVSDNRDALTSVYEWRCPTCSKDARPSSLVIDGFLQEVRDQLTEAGNTEARAIIVKKDGSWMVKQEVDGGGGRVASQSESRQPGKGLEKNEGRPAVATEQAAVTPHAQVGAAAASANAQNAPSRVIEIIDLDDD